MREINFALEYLRTVLQNKGIAEQHINVILDKARREMIDTVSAYMREAMDQAIAAGVAKESADFINDLRPAPDAFELETASGRTEFVEPPFPMLPHLLKSGKVSKKGGVYKVIPVGAGSNKPSIARNIWDAQRAIDVQRKEEAARTNKTRRDAKTIFRTATSKQDPAKQWVLPEKRADFNDDLQTINQQLKLDIDNAIADIIRSYEEGF